MKAKDYLMQLKKLDRLIENKKAELEQWVALATSTTVTLNANKVQTTSDPQKMASAVLRILEIKTEMNDYMNRLIDIKLDVIGTIEKLNAGDYDILHNVYVQGVSLDKYAFAHGKSYGWAKNRHSRAMKKLQRLMDGREWPCAK